MRNLFFLAFLFLTLSSTAQVTEGHANYKIKITTDDPEMMAAMTMMENSNMDLYFTDQKTRTELDLSMFTTTIITDNTTDKAVILMDMMGMKIALRSSVTELNEKGDNKTGKKPKIKFTKKTKEFLGYKCKQAIVTGEDGLESTFWYTEEIAPISTEGQELFESGIPGFVMSFNTVSEGLEMEFTINIFSDNTSDFNSNTFSTEVPEGYKEMTEEEIEQMGM